MLGETVEELRSVAVASDDATGYFPAMYARVTQRIQHGVGTGEFADSDAMAGFAASFARWYLDPMAGRSPMPQCWQATRDVAGDRQLLIVQHLLLGVNAHVNHDLPQVVVEVADDGDDLQGMRRDFDAVNDVLAATMPDVLRDLGRVSSWVNAVAGRGGGRLFRFSLEAARAQAWQTAERLHPLDDAGRADEVAALDDVVGGVAYVISRPPWPARWLAPFARVLEDHDPERVTKSLLGPLA